MPSTSAARKRRGRPEIITERAGENLRRSRGPFRYAFDHANCDDRCAEDVNEKHRRKAVDEL